MIKNVIKFDTQKEYEYIESILLKNGFKWIGHEKDVKHPYRHVINSFLNLKYFEILDGNIYLVDQDSLNNENYKFIVFDKNNVDFFIESHKMGLF